MRHDAASDTDMRPRGARADTVVMLPPTLSLASVTSSRGTAEACATARRCARHRPHTPAPTTTTSYDPPSPFAAPASVGGGRTPASAASGEAKGARPGERRQRPPPDSGLDAASCIMAHDQVCLADKRTNVTRALFRTEK